MQPQVVTPSEGFHNRQLEKTRDRLLRGATYRDCSTICVVPTRGLIAAKVVQSWMGLFAPMNQKFTRLFGQGMEVADAYNQMIEIILANSELRTWKYLLTLEEDNVPPPDGLLKLIEDINSGPWSAVGGLYWTKGEGGQPMCYGQPGVMPKNFIPWLPPANAVTECNGLGMGFTLFKLDMFKDLRIEKPWFRTVQQYTPGVGSQAFTQDLHFFQKAAGAGHRFACSTRVLVGHLDVASDQVW